MKTLKRHEEREVAPKGPRRKEADVIRLDDFKHKPITTRARWKLLDNGCFRLSLGLTDRAQKYIARFGHRTVFRNPKITIENRIVIEEDIYVEVQDGAICLYFQIRADDLEAIPAKPYLCITWEGFGERERDGTIPALR